MKATYRSSVFKTEGFHDPNSKQHNLDIDVLKALLIIGMVLAHAIVILGDKNVRSISQDFKVTIFLVSYSGFLFCFGYTTWLSYFSKETSFKRILTSVVRIVIAYYISAYIYTLFVDRAYGNADLFNVLIITKLVLYSEFLFGFALTLLAGYLLRKPIGFILERPKLFYISIGILLLTTFIPSQWVQSAWVSMFIGSPEDVTTSFPLLQYFAIYLLGMYYARYNIKPNLLIGLAGIAAYYLYSRYGGSVTRYPPNFAWVTISFFYVITWYSIAKFIGRWKVVHLFLVPMGINSLFYMVMSNVMIFAFRGAMPKLGGAMSLKTTGIVSIAIIVLIYYLTTIVRRVDIEKIFNEEQTPAVTETAKSG